MTRLLILLCFCLSLPTAALQATTPDCETLAADASRRYGMPKGLLIAIARTESGIARNTPELRAWPWTTNVQGKSHYYDSHQEMLTHLDRVVSENISNFDVGCMQLNYRWHIDRFDSLEHMIDPTSNVAYAARYLSQLYHETGSWETATRYYHSRDPKRGATYLDRVRGMQATLNTSAKPPEMVTLSTRGPTDVSDRPAPSRNAVVQDLELRFYWEGVNLAEGALPKMPRRP